MLRVLIRIASLFIGLYEDLTKIIFQISSNTHLISSSACTSDTSAKVCLLSGLAGFVFIKDASYFVCIGLYLLKAG